MAKTCSVEGCTETHEAKGYCVRHYSKKRMHGTPFGGTITRHGESHEWILSNLNYSGDDCLTFPYARSKSGYGSIHIDGKTEYAHGVVVTIVHGPRPTPKHEVAHSCGNGRMGCVNPRHLRWATHSENLMDRLEHGTGTRGEMNVKAKLTQKDVLSIVSDDRSQSTIAEDYGVRQQQVSMIKNGKSWQWLTGISQA